MSVTATDPALRLIESPPETVIENRERLMGALDELANQSTIADTLDSDPMRAVYKLGWLAQHLAFRHPEVADEIAAMADEDPPAPTPAEDKVTDLMQALADSVDQAKAARLRHEAKPVHRCSRCATGIGGCMTEGCPGPEVTTR